MNGGDFERGLPFAFLPSSSLRGIATRAGIGVEQPELRIKMIKNLYRRMEELEAQLAPQVP
jgi:hypothetical protein